MKTTIALHAPHSLIALLAALLVGLGLIPTASVAQEAFPGVQALMSDDELRATGLDRLTTDQLQALDAWIDDYLADDGATLPIVTEAPGASPRVVEPAPVPDDDFGRPRERQEILSRIDGEFNGWEGNTRFYLENGQVWEQRRGRRWKVTLDNPQVRLYQNWMGAWEMEVISEERSIGVRRIR